ncbi:thiol peroxidase, atypical 2-Cys peroxiredoxin [Aquimarina sp. MAR_2010_214]|uniref:thiol peroxidase n=1 Tax=Aquimarina sp. MAR_2010_214 TaxID=1250026 RepID=UPI000C7105BD|nr:thiol peroxidase [Aquimarina sp. MAR_2010_214]PKV50575.1 thiol peroxidase, atypical 2-Cys peroxiredoxin [Aquimarina sp. MAR_2010_214]
MASITLKGNTIHTSGDLPEVGQNAPDFEMVNADLSTAKLSDYKGNRVVLNIFPSVDTGICAASVRAFNKEASNLSNTKVLCVSRDLPFAQGRFCGAEGLENVINHSDFKTGEFGKNYGLEIVDGPLQGLHSRAVIVLDENGTVLYTEQVPEIVQEPDYSAALAILS